MRSYERRYPHSENLYKKSGGNFLEVSEVTEISEGMVLSIPHDLQSSPKQLREYAATLQIQNKELKAYARMVGYVLKDPLTILIVTSELITDIPDLTQEELKAYLQQLKSVAHEMDESINSLLLFTPASMGVKLEE